MAHPKKISFLTAVLTNFNVMFGTGVFINTVVIAHAAGFLGFLTYACVAILLIPLLVCTAGLLRAYPHGGFYAYASETMNSFAGFISAWAYFIGKLASAALLIHVFSLLMTALFPSILSMPPLVLDCIILVLFSWLIAANLKVGDGLMYVFMSLKILPVIVTILACLCLYAHWNIPAETLLWSGVARSIPLVLFAFTGFEICCSLSGMLENSAKNGPRIIFLTFGIVAGITIVYQCIIFLAVGKELLQQESFFTIFPVLFNQLFPSSFVPYIAMFMQLALACASLGGSYGILFGNHWNLYTLARNNHTFFSSALMRLNSRSMPTLCIISEAILCGIYLLITQGTVTLLQQISVLGVSVAYTCNMISFLRMSNRWSRQFYWAIAALISCWFFLFSCIQGLYCNGFQALYGFLMLLLCGIIMFFKTQK